jgi:hypothetical protein
MTRLAWPRVSVQTSALVSIVHLVSVQPNRGTKCVTSSAIAERYKHVTTWSFRKCVAGFALATWVCHTGPFLSVVSTYGAFCVSTHDQLRTS